MSEPQLRVRTVSDSAFRRKQTKAARKAGVRPLSLDSLFILFFILCAPGRAGGCMRR